MVNISDNGINKQLINCTFEYSIILPMLFITSEINTHIKKSYVKERNFLLKTINKKRKKLKVKEHIAKIKSPVNRRSSIVISLIF